MSWLKVYFVYAFILYSTSQVFGRKNGYYVKVNRALTSDYGSIESNGERNENDDITLPDDKKAVNPSSNSVLEQSTETSSDSHKKTYKIRPSGSNSSVYNPACTCGVLMFDDYLRLIDPFDVGIRGVPFHVGLVQKLPRNNQPFCGGTLISLKFVLTAASCLFTNDEKHRRRKKSEYEIIIGANEIITKHRFVVSVIDEKLHPKYNASENNMQYKFNIALLQLEYPLVINREVAVACLPRDEVYKPKDLVFVVGWGFQKDDFPNKPSTTLKYQNMTIMSANECARKAYPKLTYEFDNVSDCIFEKDKGPCDGDFGGGVISFDNYNNSVVMGVMSYNRECATTPTIYTNVNKVYDWIILNSDALSCRMPWQQPERNRNV